MVRQINDNKAFNKLASDLKKAPLNYKENMQIFLIYAIKEYSFKLSFNCTKLCEVLKGVDEQYLQLIKKWLVKNTNIKTLKIKDNTLTHFGEVLMFKDSENIPLWYIKEKKEKEEAVKDSEAFKKAVKNLYKRFKDSEESLDEQCKHILTVINI